MSRLLAALTALVLIATPAGAWAATTTVTDEVGEISPGPEISDLSAATVEFSAKRITIQVTHRSWNSEVSRKRAATGGRITFPKGGTFFIITNADGRRSLLFRKKGLRNCPDGKSCSLPCTGWRHDVDRPAMTTSVSVPVRCFGFAKPPTRVKVLPMHILPVVGQAPVYDPVPSTGWLTRG